jgi:hypothetical protein
MAEGTTDQRFPKARTPLSGDKGAGFFLVGVRSSGSCAVIAERLLSLQRAVTAIVPIKFGPGRELSSDHCIVGVSHRCGATVDKVEHHRRLAAQCVDRAAGTADPQLKATWISMAGDWLTLADLASSIASSSIASRELESKQRTFD